MGLTQLDRQLMAEAAEIAARRTGDSRGWDNLTPSATTPDGARETGQTAADAARQAAIERGKTQYKQPHPHGTRNPHYYRGYKTEG